ncbi:MAG TPA: glycosyltransferase family 4 protein [Verrucomicrobiae bacterium]|jgi:glycosyltransferase involved in cell wall biosynthesis|nr:glycosyltransferase family 4 protein [Verrucomicrobiae bacterium]
MKVLFANNLYAPNVRGGAERAIQNLAEALVRRGDEAVVASTVSSGAPSERVINGVKAMYVPIANLYWPFDRIVRSSARRKLWHAADAYNPAMKHLIGRIISEERPDLVHSSNLQGISVGVWHAARAEGVPIVHTLQDYYLTCGRCSRYRNGRTCERTCWDCMPLFLARRRASEAVSAVVGVSRYILEHHRRLGLFSNANSTSVIPHESPAVPAMERPALPANAPVAFGYFGRLVPEKGIETLIDVFTARPAGEGRLFIGGEGEDAYSGELHRRAARRNARDISFLGWIEPADFFPQVDVLVLPSLWQEPLARVIPEAFSYGVPVIGSVRGGIPELVKDGLNGLLFDPDEPGALAAAIDRLREDRALLRGLSINAARSARENSLERILGEYDEAYAKALADRRKAI